MSLSPLSIFIKTSSHKFSIQTYNMETASARCNAL